MENFGSNVQFEPRQFYQPRTESEVLQILAHSQGQRIKVIGRLHAWSEAAAGDEVVLDLRYLNQVEIEQRSDGPFARAGAGCQIKKLLADLERVGLTTPSLGLITEQAIAGAISTGTHGSGRHSLSHYVAEVRIATYASNGQPEIRTITEGPELQAARCSLGLLGVILSIGFRPRPLYRIEEWIDRYPSLDTVLAAEEATPLQQFYLVPWSWDYFVQHRRETDAPRSWLATLYSLYCFLTLDIGLHLGVLFLERICHLRSAIRSFYRYVLPATVIRRWKISDQSDKLLIMEHELFRHIEIEVFVPRSRLAEAIQFVQQMMQHYAGEPDGLSEATRQQLQTFHLLEEIEAGRGQFIYNYLLCVRKVLADETLISMAASDNESWYALSMTSYAHPRNRNGFFQFALGIANSLAALFGGRPHWGKYCPLSPQVLRQLYPRWADFQKVRAAFDPQAVFQNSWLEQVFADENAAGD